MPKDVRRNDRGDIKLASITPWSFKELLAAVGVNATPHFECPVCHGIGKEITRESSIRLGNTIDDHGNDQGCEPDYQKCLSCRGSGRPSTAQIHLGFHENPNSSESSGIDLVMKKEVKK